MNSSNPLVTILVVLFVLGRHDPILCDNYEVMYASCANMFSCGSLKNICYPFWGGDRPSHCGHPEFQLGCPDGHTPNITIMSVDYLVKDIVTESQTLKIARRDLADSVCPGRYVNTTLDFNIFNYSLADENATLLYDCKKVSTDEKTPLYGPFTCHREDTNQTAYVGLTKDLANELLVPCNGNIVVPILKSPDEDYNISVYKDALSQGFEVVWRTEYDALCRNCEVSIGRCGFDVSLKKFICLCGDRSYDKTCPATTPEARKVLDWKTKVGIGFGVFGGTVLLMGVIFFLCQRRRKTTYASSAYVTRSISTDPSSINDPENMGALCGVKFFTYDELQEATDGFHQNREIGDGGFGTVYLGKLQDGRNVAVKRLYENNFKRVEQFLNEVEILTRLRHKHLVQLYGCTSRHSRELLLVYEYIPNGTVADHLHGKKAKPESLPWQTRLKIAVETASALKYLHASEIIHRDVKTNNILLDENFTVKVADFGLSRLFPLDVTHVSTAPQGTPGYVDPDYYQCYQLTSKSDVYSFGVVLVELISSKTAVDITRHRHEINLSNMAKNKIQSDALEELVDPSLGFNTDPEVHSMIRAVAGLAFRCLQSDKDLRPSMEEVLEILTHTRCDESHNEENAVELDIFSDEFVLLKSGPLQSPDSVTAKWASVSHSTASNTSG